jgi:gliding motility-associated-like protein
MKHFPFNKFCHGSYPTAKHNLVGLLLCLFLFPLSVTAQENCSNGIDDDGDNLIDVFDSDCPCDDQTLLCEPSCEFAIPGGALNFKSQWKSNALVPIYQTPLVADMDGDQIPDVIIMSADSLKSGDPRRSKNILIISGATGATITKITTPFMAWVGPNPYAVADIDSDGFGEIIIASVDHPDNPATERRFLFCYEHTGALKWKSNSQYGNGSNARFGSAVGIADFNRDGIPEAYIYNQIFNALTGRKVIDGGAGNGLSIMTNQAFGDLANPVAADITSSPGMELACGNTVYNVLLTNNGGLPGNSMTPIRIASEPDGYTSLADIDLDGKMDVVVAAQGATGKLYVWNPNEGSPQLIASVNLPNTGGNWIGVPFIGDMDKDCEPEIGVTRAGRVYALDYDGSNTLASKWILNTSDASGFTGITMFDFNQDGSQELVYRDESTLRVFDGSGSTPVVIGSNPCSSGTGSEMPVVADIDGDGQAEICVTCATSGNQLGKVNVFESSGQSWAPCRPIWNQFNYLNVNINNNLTIPRQQQPHQVLLSNKTCPFYNCNENRPFNNFMTQVTFLTQEGCPIYPAADVSLDIVSQQCESAAKLNLVLRVANAGGSPSGAGYPIRFYAGNPFTGPASLISSSPDSIATDGPLNPGESINIPVSLDIRNYPKPFRLTILLNDDGSKTIPFNFPITALPECDYLNNIKVIDALDCCPAGDLSISGFNPPSVSFCEGAQTSLRINATSSQGIGSNGYFWTLPDNSTLTGPEITASGGGNYSVAVQDSAQCRLTASIQITAFPQPTAASAGSDQTVCTETATLQGNVPNTGTGLWSVLEGDAVLSNPSQANASLINLSPGLNRFRWAISSGGFCISDDTVSIIREIPPSEANAGADQTICAGTSALSATAPLLGTGRWSIISGSGLLADSTLPNSAVTELGAGINIFRWTVSNGACPVSTDEITITRFAPPSLANAGPNQLICGTQTGLQAEAPVIGTGSWSLISGSGTFSDTAAFNTLVIGLAAGDNVFRWTITNGICAASTDDIVITRNQSPAAADAGSGQQICADFTALGAAIPPVGTGAWSLVSGSGTISDTLNANSAVTGLAPGNNVFAWTVRNGVCPPSIAQVIVRRDLPPSAADAGPDQRICSESAVLSGSVPVTGTGTWSLLSGSGAISNPDSPASAITGLTPGSNIFQWAVSNGSCPATSSTVTILIDFPVSEPDAGSNLQICSAETVLAAVPPLTGSGSWSLISGAATFANPASPGSAISGVGVGTNLLRWTVINGTCSDSTEISVTRFLPPDPASAGPDQLICATVASLNAESPGTGTGNWSVASGSGNFGNPADPKDLINNLSVGENILVWTIYSGACAPESDSVRIIVSANPVNPDAGTDFSVCEGSAGLNAVQPTVGNGSWSVVSGLAMIADTLNNRSGISNLGEGPNVFRWTVVNGACVAFDLVTITRDIPPSPAMAGADQVICSDTTSLMASDPVNGIGSWSLSSGKGTIIDSLNSATFVKALQPGINVFTWTVQSGVCPPASDQLSVEVLNKPSVPDAGRDQQICADTLKLSAAIPDQGIGSWSVSSGFAQLDDSTNAQTILRSIPEGTTILRWTIRNGICPPAFDEITINRDSNPSASDAGPDQRICSDSARMAARIPLSGTGTWTIVTGSGSFQEPTSATTMVSGIAQGVNVFQWNVANGVCSPSADQVVIIRDSSAIQADAGRDIRLCASDSAVLQATDPFPAAGFWSLVSGTASIANPDSPLTLVTGLGGNSAVFRWTVTPAACSGSSDEVNVINELLPDTAFAGNDTALCGTSLQLTAKVPAVGTGKWLVLGGTGITDNENLANTQVSNLSPGLNLLVWTVTNGACPPSADTLKITIDNNPIIPNAGADQKICADTARLSAAIPALGTGVWTLTDGNAAIADSAFSGSFVSNLGPGDNTFRWTVSNGLCTVFDEVVIRRDLPPDPAQAGADQQVCDSVAVLGASTPLTGVGVWTVLSGDAALDTLTKPAAIVTIGSPGVVTLRWTISSGVCPDTSDEVTISRQAAPSKANAGTDFSVCQDTTVLSADPALNGSGFWSVVSGNGMPDDATIANTILRGLQPGIVILRWTVADTGACKGSFDEVTVTRDTPPDKAVLGADTVLCGDSIQLVANVPGKGTGRWIVVGGNALVADSSAATTDFTRLGIGNNVFEWRISNGSCAPSTDQITVFRSDTAFAGQDLIVCDSVVTLNATGALSGKGRWTVLAGKGLLADSSLENTLVTNLSGGANVFVWTISGSLCTDSTDTVTISRKCNIPPLVTPDSLVILEDESGSSSILIGDIDPDGTTLFADTIPLSGPSHGSIRINADGSYTYTPEPDYYGLDTVIIAVCDSGIPLPPTCSPDTLIIRIKPVNDPPLIKNDTAETAKSTPVSGNVLLNDSDKETALRVDTIPVSVPSNGTIILKPDGSFIYTPDPDFTGTDTVVIQVCDTGFPLPPLCLPDTLFILVRDTSTVQADAGSDQTICNFSAILNASPPEPPATGVWLVIEGNGILSDSINPAAQVTGLGVGINRFVWIVSIGTQTSRDTVTIMVNQPATPAFAGEDQTICGSSAELQGNIAVNGTGTWSLVSGTGSVSDPVSAQVLVGGLLPGSSRFAWSIKNGPCTSSDTVNILVFSLPVVSAGTDTAFCPSTEAFRLSGSNSGNASGVWSVLLGASVVSNPDDPQSTVAGLTPGKHLLLFSATNGPCSFADTLHINVLNGDSLPCKAPELFIPEGFSPDDDGTNDKFVIYGLNGKRLSLLVFNRWGQLVYESGNYLNNWDGRCNQPNVINGDYLPESTYFYIIRIEGEQENRKGYLTLWR